MAAARRSAGEALATLAGSLGALACRPAPPFDASLLREQGLLPPFRDARSRHGLAGTVGGVPVTIADLRLTVGWGPWRRAVFAGLLLRVALPRALAGTVCVAADADAMARCGRLLGARGGARVRLGAAAFDELYRIHATDRDSAHALLGPALVDALTALARGAARPLVVAHGIELVLALPRPDRLSPFEALERAAPRERTDLLAALSDDLRRLLAAASATREMRPPRAGGVRPTDSTPVWR